MPQFVLTHVTGKNKCDGHLLWYYRAASIDVCCLLLCSDAKEIDPSDIVMKERLGAGQFGVSVSLQLAGEFCTFLFAFCTRSE